MFLTLWDMNFESVPKKIGWYFYFAYTPTWNVRMYVTTFWKEDLLNLTNFGAVYLTQFLTDCSQILDSKSYDQA